MPIRWRLTLWFALIVCAILVLSGTVLHILLQHYLNGVVDNNLSVYSARVHGTLNPKEIPDPLDYVVIHDNLPPIDEFTSPGLYIQFIDREGNVVVKSDNLGSKELPISWSLINAGFEGNVSIETVAAGNDTGIRIMVSPMYLTDETLLLEVAQSLEPIEAMMRQVRWALLVGVILALILAVISGAIIARRALSPVERITGTARSIEASSDLSRRVGYRGPMDEVGRLAMTFDHLIDHLDRVFQSQKYFVTDASHELRNPLAVIKGNLDLLDLDLGPEDRQVALKAIKAETERMINMVSVLLLLAEVESGQVEMTEMVPLEKILLEEKERVRQLAGDRKIMVVREEDLSVKGDVYRLKQLLGNLVDNAIKYTSDGGTITLSLFRSGGWACLEVADTGIGIAPEHLPHIFDRFYRVDKARTKTEGGTGLGLAMAKGIAEQHGGRLTVTSELGKGSTFTVWLKL